MIWLLYVLGAAGLSVVLVMSKIALPIRKALPPPIGLKGLPPHKLCDISESAAKMPATLLGCCLCTGVWTGLFMGGLYVVRSFLPVKYMLIPDAFAMAFAGSIVSYCIFAYLCYVKAP